MIYKGLASGRGRSITGRYGLRDDQWKRIKDLLAGREETVGVTAKDNRLFIDAVLYRYRAGIPWRDLPGRFGDFRLAHTRFTRWGKSGVGERIFNHLAGETDKAYDAEELVLRPLEQTGKTCVIPPWGNRKHPRTYDRELYKARHLIENFFAKLKQYRASPLITRKQPVISYPPSTSPLRSSV